MKKVFLMAILAIAGMWSANAQKFGVKAGYNYALLTNDFGDGRHGFYVGALFDWNLTEAFSLQPEVRYSMQGDRKDEATLKLDYINLPIMAKLNLGDKFSILAGPQFGFLVSSKASYSGVSVTVGEFNEFDFALAAGAMFKTENGLFVELRVTPSITKIVSEGERANFVPSVGIGLLF